MDRGMNRFSHAMILFMKPKTTSLGPVGYRHDVEAIGSRLPGKLTPNSRRGTGNQAPMVHTYGVRLDPSLTPSVFLLLKAHTFCSLNPPYIWTDRSIKWQKNSVDRSQDNRHHGSRLIFS